MYTTSVLGHILAAINRQNLLLAISAANAVINVALNFALIPLMGHDGAAAATVITELIGLLMLSTAVSRRFGQVFDFSSIARISAASFLILPLWFLTDWVGVVPLVLAGGLIYMLALLGLGAVTLDDAKRVISVVSKRSTTREVGQ
jgi:O-antigen/teichoic acid export membrane protein